MHLVDGQAVEVEDGVVTLVLVVAPSEEVFWAKAASWSEAQHHAFHFERLSPRLSPRLTCVFILDLLLLGGLRRLERVRDCSSQPSKLLQGFCSKSAPFGEALQNRHRDGLKQQRLLKHGFDVVDLGLGGGGAGVVTGG